MVVNEPSFEVPADEDVDFSDGGEDEGTGQSNEGLEWSNCTLVEICALTEETSRAEAPPDQEDREGQGQDQGNQEGNDCEMGEIVQGNNVEDDQDT